MRTAKSIFHVIFISLVFSGVAFATDEAPSPRAEMQKTLDKLVAIVTEYKGKDMAEASPDISPNFVASG
jgi:hypothetical protein